MKKIYLLLLLCWVNVAAFGQVLNSESFDGTTFPPSGWVTTTGATYPWSRATTGTNPPCSTHSGAGMAFVQDYNASSGTVVKLTTPVIDLSNVGSNTPTVTVWFYRDVSNYNTSGYNGEGTTLYINTSNSTTGATTLGYVPRRGGQATSGSYISGTSTTTTSGWFQYTFTIPSTFNTATNYLIFSNTSKLGDNQYMDDVTWQSYPTPCTGTPAPGTASASITNGCSTFSTTLSLSGTSSGSGITYQWQSSTNGTTFTAINGATNSTYAATVSANTYYNCLVSCTSLSQASNSVYCTIIGTTYATLPFTESFETAWSSCSGTDDRINPYWTNLVATGNDSWRRDDDGASASWSSPTYGAYTPAATVGAHSARFHNGYANSGTTGAIDLHVDMSGTTYPKLISFDYVQKDVSYPTTNLTVLLSTDGGSTFPTTLTSLGQNVQSWTTYTMTTTSTSATTVIRFFATSGFGSNDMGVDNVNVISLAPTLSVTPTSLSYGNVQTGINSPSQSFSVSGTYLTGVPGTVTVTAPSNFQVSNNNSSWGGTASISYTAATLASTPVYVRFNPTAATAYSGNVTLAATGATTASVSVTGTGAPACTTPIDQPTAISFSGTTGTTTTATLTDASPPVGGYMLIASNGAFTGTITNGVIYTTGTVIGNGTVVGISATQTVSITGLTPNSTNTITVFPYSNSGTCAGPVYNTVNPLIGTVTTCLAVPASVATSNLGSGGFTLSWTASGGATSYIVDVSANNAFTAPVTGSPFTVTATIPTVTTTIGGLQPSTAYYYRITAVGGSCNSAASATATVTTTGGTAITVASGFNYDVIANGANTVPGSTTIPSTGYDGGGWVYYSNDFYTANGGSNGYTGLPNSGSFTSAATAGIPYQFASYSANNCLWLPATAGNTGTLTFANPVYASTLYVLGNEGSGGSCTAETVNLTITYTDNTTQAGSVVFGDWYGCTPIALATIGRVGQSSNFDGASNGPNFYEKTLAITTYTKPIKSVQFTTTTGGGDLGIFALSVRNGTLTASTNSLSFSGTSACGSSAAQIFSVSGTNLYPSGGSITVNAPAGFQVSGNGTSWGSTAAIAYTANTMTNVPVYVQFDPTTGGNFSGNITFSGGTVNNPPTLPVSGVAGGLAILPAATAAFGNITEFVTSGAQTYTLTGTGLTAGIITVTSSNADFQVSPDNTNWYTTYNFSNGTTLSATPVYIHFTPTTASAETATVSVTGGGTLCGASINATGAGAIACTTPGTPTAISFPNTNSSGTGISFTPGGTPDGYMIVQGSSAFTGTATNTVTYSTGNIITNGTVVGNYANTLPVTISSQILAPINGNTNYRVSVIPFNGGTFGTCGSGPIYAPAPYLQGNYTTCPVSAATTPSSITTTSFILSWPSSSGGAATTVTYKLEVAIDAGFLSPVTGYPQIVADVPAGTVTQTISGLVSGTPYYYRITAIGACNSTPTTGSVTTATPSYCAPTYAISCSGYYASSVTGQGLTYTAAGGCGAGNQLAHIATVTPGVAATLTVVTQGYTGCTIWADLNGNGTFDNNELLDGDSLYSGAGPATYAPNIGVPANTPPGNYRMRLITGWGTQGYFATLPGSGSTNNGYGPCGSYQYETYEDFTLQVVPAPILTVSPTSVSFNSVQICSVSPTQSVTVTGSFLQAATGSITATAPTGFRVSNNGTTWGTTATLAYTGSAVSAPLYIDFNPSTTGAASGNIVLSGGGASISPSVSVSGTGTLPPTPQPISGTTNFCYNGTTINSSLGETLSGGTWSSTSPTVATVDNSGNLAVLGVGTTTIIYSITTCSITSSVTALVTVNQTPTSVITPSGTVTACGSQTLTATTGSNYTYQWYNSSGIIAGATNSTYALSNAGSVSTTNTYSVQVTNSISNCSSTSAATTVTLNPVPTATITTPGGITSSCGGTIVMTGNTNIGNTYQWSNSLGTINGATAGTYTATVTGTYSVNIKQNSTGCNLSSATTTININAIPTASLSPTGTVTACGSQTLTASTDIGNVYQWYNTSGIIAGATGNTYVAANTGSVQTTNTYSVVVTNSLTTCNNASSAVIVTLNPVPTATVTTPGNITANCADIVMTANTNIGNTYQWSNSSGIIPGATTNTYTATVSSTYFVNIKQSSTGCNLSTAGLAITIVPPPSASVSPSGTVTTCGSQVLAAVTDFGNAYQWYNSSGIINGATNSTYTAVNVGTVSATNTYSVVITNTVTNCGNTSPATMVILNPVPSASVSPTGTVTACGTQTLTAGTNIGNRYQWYNTSGAISGATNSTYALNNAGSTSVTNTYSVQVTNATTNCNSISAGTTVILNAIPTASVTPTGTVTACGSELLTVGTNIGDTYQWYSSTSGVIGGATNSTYTASNNGSVSVTAVYSVQVTNSGTTCNLTSAGTTVKLDPLPTSSVTPTGTVTACGSQVLTAGTNIGNAYQWYNTSGAISGATNSTYAAINSGSVSVTNTYSVVVTNSTTNCNSTSAGTMVILNPGPTSIVSPSGTVTACGAQVLTAVTNIGNAYQWYNTSGIIPGATNSTYTAINGGATTVTNSYSVVVTNSTTTCNSTSPATTVILNPIPTSSVTPTGTVTSCGSQLLTAGTNIGNRYQWYNGSGAINGATNNTYTVSNTGSVTTTNVYSVTVTNSTTNCNSTSPGTTVILNAIPTASVSPTGTVTACGSELLTAGTNIGDTYQWYSNTGGAIAGATNSTYTATNNGSVSTTIVYSVQVTNSTTNCNLTSAGTTVKLNPIPTSSVTPTGTVTACGSQLLTAGTNIGNRYQWYNGSGLIAGATNNTYTVNNTGSVSTTDVYSVTVTSSTTGCNSTSPGTTVILNAIPTSTVTTAGGITTNCGSLVLTGSSNIGNGYQWYNSGGVINGATNSSYTATVSSTYYMKATNTATGCNSNSASLVITINPYPVVTVTPNGPTTFCAGSSITLTASNGYSYQWQNYGVNIAGATSHSYTSSQSGIFRVILSTTVPCIDTTTTTTITVNPLPSEVITASGPLTFCSGGSVVLSAQTGLATYQWVKPVNAIFGANTNSYTATTSGSYRVAMTTNSNCRDTSIVMVVDAEPLPDNTVTVSGATTFCAGGSVTLAAPSGMASYQWHDSTSAIPGAAGQSYTTGTSGSYKVFVSNGQCSDSSVAEVITNASADTSLTIVGGYRVVSGTLTVCEGSALNLSTLAGASSYQWDSSTVMIPGANTQTYTVTESGVYTLIMNSSFGCTDSVSRSVTVDTLPLPVIFEYGYGLQTTQAYTSYQWYLNGVAIPGATSRDYLVTTEGPYTVMATDANGCAGMSASITLNSLNVGNVTGIDISLYPNPATSVVYIQSPVKVKAVVYTIEGQEVTSKADAKDIDLSRFANGTYMVKLFGEDGTLLKVSKLVKSE